MKTTYVLAHYEGKGLLVKDACNYYTSLGSDFENESDYMDAILKFDTKEQATAFIEQHGYWAFDAVETPVSFFENVEN